MSSTGFTDTHPDNTKSPTDSKPTPSDPVTSHNGATSTAADDKDTNPGMTPYNFGATSHRAFHMKYDRKDYDNFIREDLATRVFIPSDDFLRVILHLPGDWRQDSSISALIRKVKDDEQWMSLWKVYKLKRGQTDEILLHHPHNSLCNRALDLITSDSPSATDNNFYRQAPNLSKEPTPTPLHSCYSTALRTASQTSKWGARRIALSDRSFFGGLISN